MPGWPLHAGRGCLALFRSPVARPCALGEAMGRRSPCLAARRSGSQAQASLPAAGARQVVTLGDADKEEALLCHWCCGWMGSSRWQPGQAACVRRACRAQAVAGAGVQQGVGSRCANATSGPLLAWWRANLPSSPLPRCCSRIPLRAGCSPRRRRWRSRLPRTASECAVRRARALLASAPEGVMPSRASAAGAPPCVK